MSQYEVIAEGLAFPEGPVIMADGSVILVEILAGQVTRCWGQGRKEVVAKPGGGPNGAATAADGSLWVCNNGGMAPGGAPGPGRIERVDLATGKAEPVYTECEGAKLSAPNDLMFDCDGNVWFTDLGRFAEGHSGKQFGGLYCAAGDGSWIRRIEGNCLSYNGVGLSPDWKTVYVADTYSARVYAYERRAEAQSSRWVASVPGKTMLDSLAMTAAGNVCVATMGADFNGASGGAITTVTPAGAVTQVAFDDPIVTNIAFGGADMMDAWITFSGRGALVKTRWSEPGMRLVYEA